MRKNDGRRWAAMALGTFFAFGLALPAAGHGIWVAPRHGALAVVYGAGPVDDAYAPEKLKSAKAFDANGASVALDVQPQKTFVTVTPASGAAVLALELDNGVWTKDAGGKFRNVPRAAVPNAEAALHSYKFATHVLTKEAPAAKPLGLRLEIVPLVNPVALKVGEDLPIQVLFEGKPLAGAVVKADYVNDANTKTGKTDADGKIRVPIRNDGHAVIGVSHSNPVTGSKEIDRESLFAALSFVIAFVED